jgi:hypothetical protein
MTGRRWISIVAIIGMLLHAGLFARHSAMALKAALGDAATAGFYGVICSTNDVHIAVDRASQDPGDQSGHKPFCPFCLGVLSGAALLPAPFDFQVHQFYRVFDKRVAEITFRPAYHLYWPPGRAPPFLT